LWWLHITSEVQKEVARLRETIATTKERKMSKNKYVLTKTTTSFRAKSFVIALHKCGFTIVNPNKTTISVVSL